MGQTDRDYWHRDKPFTQARHETSFLSKLLITLAVLLMCAVAYRYQAEIKRWVQKSVERPAQRAQAPVLPAPAVVPAPAPAVPQNPRPETSGQIYRCGNTYSHEPCDNARQISVPTNASRDMSATKEIYLCKDIYDRLTWESTPCSANGRFMDRSPVFPRIFPGKNRSRSPASKETAPMPLLLSKSSLSQPDHHQRPEPMQANARRWTNASAGSTLWAA